MLAWTFTGSPQLYYALNQETKVIHRGKVIRGETEQLEAIHRWPKDKIAVALETGSMTWWEVDMLHEAGIEPIVVDARQFKMIAGSKKRSDRHAARALADGLRGGLTERIAVNFLKKKCIGPGL